MHEVNLPRQATGREKFSERDKIRKMVATLGRLKNQSSIPIFLNIKKNSTIFRFSIILYKNLLRKKFNMEVL